MARSAGLFSLGADEGDPCSSLGSRLISAEFPECRHLGAFHSSGTLALALRSLADAKQADTDESASAGLRSPAGVNVVRFDQSASDFK